MTVQFDRQNNKLLVKSYSNFGLTNFGPTEAHAANTIFMIKVVSSGIQGFALYPSPSRADSFVVLNQLSS